jgi:hypothetical protein
VSVGSDLHWRDRTWGTERGARQHREDRQDFGAVDCAAISGRVTAFLLGRRGCEPRWQFRSGGQECSLFNLPEPFSGKHIPHLSAFGYRLETGPIDIYRKLPIDDDPLTFHVVSPFAVRRITSNADGDVPETLHHTPDKFGGFWRTTLLSLLPFLLA